MRLLFAIALALSLVGCSGGGDDDSPCPRPKNVLLLVGDTLRSDRLGCYGYPRDTSPNIDALAARGTVYERAYSQASWTVPSMISMFSGASVTTGETTLPKLLLIPELLQAAGLETVAFPANDTLFKDRGFERGFDLFEPCGGMRGPKLAARFAEWFGAREDTERPFFAWVQFIDPHDPYNPRPEHDVFDGPGPDDALLLERWRDATARVGELSPEVESISLEEAARAMRKVSNKYDGEVLAVDEGVGAILETLRATGALDETLVIFCADHGEMLYEQPTTPNLVKEVIDKHGGLPRGVQDLFALGHRTWFYQENWNTPLIVAGPGIEAGRSDALVPNLDIYPTILDALGLAPPEHIEGQSLWCDAEPEHERVHAHSYQSSAVIESGGKKLVRYGKPWSLGGPDDPFATELFDLSEDPVEETDLSDAQPAERDRLEEAILRWHEERERDANTETTEAMKEALRKLGYIGEDED